MFKLFEKKHSPEVEELREILGPDFKRFFPGRFEGTVTKEIFQSKKFIAASYNYLSDRYGLGDRFLYIVTKHKGEAVIVLAGKVSSERCNPFEVGHGADEGLDLRKSATTVYTYNGIDLLVEYDLAKDTRNEYRGDRANVDTLLSYVRPSLGNLVNQPTTLFISPIRD